MTQPTIYALSTVYGKSGVAVIRISGTAALQAVAVLTELDVGKIKPRYAYFQTLRRPQTGESLDQALILYFRAPHSFTGEDIVEIQCHGSKAVIKSLLDVLGSLPGYRLAEPGEFSKRAFHNNKFDLTAAEGLADLIDSETSEQQKYALRQMEGSLKNLYEGWRSQLLQNLAHLEAFIDFPDEELPEDVVNNMLNDVFKLSAAIKEHLNSAAVGERLREGFRVVVVGPPNAGKSSLLNAVVKREAVIVSDIAGTTRDAIDVNLDINGYPVMFTDTAGLREVEDEIERKGIAIALNKIKEADLLICLFDACKDSVHIFENIAKSFKNKILYVANKCDNLTNEHCAKLQREDIITISAKHNQGINDLLQVIAAEISERFTSGSGLLLTRSRYRQALTAAAENLDNFSFDKEIELSAEDLRLAARELGKITGKIEVDEILDKIFGDFCIGK